jgi:hypothetical protein
MAVAGVYYPELSSDMNCLAANTIEGGHVTPNKDHFPRWYLWDSDSILRAIAWYAPEAAAEKFLAIEPAQLENGCISNEIGFTPPGVRERKAFGHVPGLRHNGFASGITQPPLLGHTAHFIGDRLGVKEGSEFYRRAHGMLYRYARFIHDYRVDPADGLPIQIHSYETGKDDPLHFAELQRREWLSDEEAQSLHWKIGAIALTAARKAFADGRGVSLRHRATSKNIMVGYRQTRHIKEMGYDMWQIMASGKGVLIKDQGFALIYGDLLRNLFDIEDRIGLPHSPELEKGYFQLIEGIETKMYYDADPAKRDEQPPAHPVSDPNAPTGYYSLDARTGQQLRVSTASTFYAGLLPEISAKRIENSLSLWTDPSHYGTPHAPPSMSATAPGFGPVYWNGNKWGFDTEITERSWRNRGYHDVAEELREKTCANPALNSHPEYVDPFTGAARGVQEFSGGASMRINLMNLMAA